MDWMKSMAQRAPGRVGVIPGRDPTNARQLLAGADLALLGPLPDPWGLGAAHAARYGAVPVLPPLPGGADELAPPALCVLPAAAGPEALAAALRDAARRLADPEGRDRLLTLALRAPRGWDEAAAELRRDVYRDGAA
jgi:glycogen synthase